MNVYLYPDTARKRQNWQPLKNALDSLPVGETLTVSFHSDGWVWRDVAQQAVYRHKPDGIAYEAVKDSDRLLVTKHPDKRRVL